jgi:hypothetical protein
MAVVTKRCACDTNFLIDLASELRVAQVLLQLLQENEYEVLVTRTPLVELERISKSSSHSAAPMALLALQKLRVWGIVATDLVSVGHGICSEFAMNLIRKGLLPHEEYEDGLVLAEAALVCVLFLVTSDAHLKLIPSDDLKLALADAHLPAIDIIHPRRLFELLRRIRLN